MTSTPCTPSRPRRLILSAIAAALLALAARGAAAQCAYPCWSEVTKAHFTFHFNSPSSVTEPSSPTYNYYLPMPPEVTRTDTAPAGCPAFTPFGSPQTLSGCASYSSLVDNHYTYDFATSSYSTTPIPGSCPVDAPPDLYYATDSGSLAGPYTGWKGIAFRGSFSGVIGSTGDSANDFLTQAVFFYANDCFEIGTEFGFYRRLQFPDGTSGAAAQEATLYFYYALNSNCGGFQPGSGAGQNQASCVHRGATPPFQASDSDSPSIDTFPITIPTVANSLGGNDWLYEAWVVANPGGPACAGQSPLAWQIQVLDPQFFSLAPGSSVQTWPITDCTFLSAASGLSPSGSGLSGDVAIVHQISVGSSNAGITAGSPAPLVAAYTIWAAK